MKKTFVLFSVLLASGTAATLAFVNNVSVIAGWWRSFLAAGGDSAPMNSIRSSSPASNGKSNSSPEKYSRK